MEPRLPLAGGLHKDFSPLSAILFGDSVPPVTLNARGPAVALGHAKHVLAHRSSGSFLIFITFSHHQAKDLPSFASTCQSR